MQTKGSIPRRRMAPLSQALCGLFLATGMVVSATSPLWAQTLSENGSPSGSPEALAAAIARKAQMPPATHMLKGQPSVPLMQNPYGLTTNGVSRTSAVVGTPITYNTNTWEFIGPRNLRPTAYPGTNYFPRIGPTSSFITGRVNGVTYDSLNPQLAYIASDGGGLWRLNLTTRQWTALGDTFPILGTSCVAVHPTNNKIIYVGLKGLGIMRSSNAGATFSNVGQQLGNVSAIAIDPDNPSTIMASADNNFPTQQGRRLWRSTDNGNTWSDVTPTLNFAFLLATEAPPMPDPTTGLPPYKYVGEGFQDVKYSAPDPNTGTRTIWATARRAGLFRSDDSGQTWAHVNAPLVYNSVKVRGTKTGAFIEEYDDRYAGGYACHVAPSAIDVNTLYVMDSNVSFADGKIFKSVDRGASWTETTGTFPAVEGPANNWTVSSIASFLEAIPTSQFNSNTGFYDFADLNYGGAYVLSSAPFGSPFWSDVSTYNGWLTHDNHHALAYFHDYMGNSNGNQLLLANDGGVYRLDDSSGTGSPSFDGTLNGLLSITEFNTAAFHPTNPSLFLGGTDANLFARSTGNLNQWVGIPVLRSTIPDTPLDTVPPTSPAPPRGVAPTIPALQPGESGGAVAYNPSDPNVQYAMTAGGDRWPNRRIYITADNWGSLVEDITPDRYLTTDTFGNTPARDSNGNQPNYVYPQVTSQDSSLANNWIGETRSATGVFTIGPSDGSTLPLYTGGSYLWRYDVLPNSANSQAFLTTPSNLVPPVAPNRDYGRWRRVGSTQLATAEGTQPDYITAIATQFDTSTNPGTVRIYVGTHLGRLWMMQNAYLTDMPTPPTVRSFISPWMSLNNDTLPSHLDLPGPVMIRREITSISVNTNRVASDILVGLQGGGVYRSANTTGTSFLFQPVNGMNLGTLPTSNVNSITRDPSDPDNTYYIGTDLGIFTTIDQGSHWSDAGQPLGLPNVAIRKVEAVPSTGYLNVATIGRGIWRFNLNPSTNPSVAAPVLAYSVTFSRAYSAPVKGQPQTSVIYAVIKVTNTGGAASGVTLNATLAGATTRTLSANLGTIAANGSTSVSLAYPGTIGIAGSSATFTVNGSYTGSGSGSAGTFGSALRTRLP